MVANDFKVKNAVSVQLQRALHDPSRGIRVLYSETIFFYIYTLFNPKCSDSISSAMRVITHDVILLERVVILLKP